MAEPSGNMNAPDKKALAALVADAEDADVLLLNTDIFSPIDWMFINLVKSRSIRRKNVVLILVTEGGDANSAFRMMRYLQQKYERITVAVSGWCKSAGTLMAIGANVIQMGDLGELGPLDVQIAKPDELGERTSGLAVETAFEKLRQEASNLFLNLMEDISNSSYPVTLKTASHIASELTVGFVSPIFEKLDPVVIAEDYRSNRVAHAYAERLNLWSKALVRSQAFDALEKVLSGYPSHGFAIDRLEAESLFKIVKPLSDHIVALTDAIGQDAIMPRNRGRGQTPKLEYLNDEPQQPKPEDKPATAKSASAGGRGRRNGNGAAKLPRASAPRNGSGKDVPATQ